MSYADDDDEYEDYVGNVAAKVKSLDDDPVKEIAMIVHHKSTDMTKQYLFFLENSKAVDRKRYCF